MDLKKLIVFFYFTEQLIAGQLTCDQAFFCLNTRKEGMIAG